ncbi:MAG TPA: YbaN family protein [Tepidiformaceae bacterium]|nr:YbaN family protein [Tepidiformaceae bacterium]
MTQVTSTEIADLTGSQGLTLRAPSRSRLVRWTFISLGSLLVAVGVLGIFLPLLPSTVFFLMALGCYGKSSPSAYRWMTTNRLFGQNLREYREEKGATVRTKVVSLLWLWGGIGLSEYFIDNLWIRLTLIAIALGVSAHLVLLRTIRRPA